MLAIMVAVICCIWAFIIMPYSIWSARWSKREKEIPQIREWLEKHNYIIIWWNDKNVVLINKDNVVDGEVFGGIRFRKFYNEIKEIRKFQLETEIDIADSLQSLAYLTQEPKGKKTIWED